MPELSYGSHFFQDLVEEDIFYAALFCEKKGVLFQKELLGKHKNQLLQYIPDAQKFTDAMAVYDIKKNKLMLMADVLSQQLICFFK
jgi:hypothetical protein